MSRQFDTHLSEDELAELDTFLLNADEGEERLSLDEAHGFITALTIMNGQQVDDDDWLELAWGQPAFANEEEQQRMTTLIKRLSYEIADTLGTFQDFEPLAVEIEEDGKWVLAYEGWCFGFMLAVSDNEEKWNQLPKDYKALLIPISRLALLHTDEEEFDLDEEECELMVELLPDAIKGLYGYWLAQSL